MTCGRKRRWDGTFAPSLESKSHDSPQQQFAKATEPLPVPTLPNEILWVVTEFVATPGPESKQNLRCLALSSRPFYVLCKPHLYRRICTDQDNLFLLVRSIIEEPELALLIQELHVGRSQDYDVGKAYTLLNRRGLAPAACTRHLHPGKEPGVTLLLIEFLLRRVHKVRRLSLELGAIPQDKYLFDAKKWSYNERQRLLPALDYLDLYLDPSDERDFYTISNVECLLKSPQLRQLHVTLHGPFYFPFICCELTALQHLDITYSGMASDRFRRLIAHCPSLSSIELWGDPSDTRYSDALFMCGAVEALSKDLTRVGIHFFHNDFHEGSVTGFETLPGITSFSRLTHLAVDFLSLLDLDSRLPVTGPPCYGKTKFLDKLPCSLEELRVFQADERIIDEFRVLAERKARDFPTLQVLVLEYYRGHGPDTADGAVPDSLQEVKTALADAGIRLVLE